MKPMNLFFLSLTALCLLLSQTVRSEEGERADRVLFNENFEDGDPKGWDLMGRGRAKVTTYAGNHSLNLSKKRSAQVVVPLEGFDRIDITMQMAAMSLKENESCRAELSLNQGKTWQTLLKVTPKMADGITLHSKTARVKKTANLGEIMLRFRANGGGRANCWGDNVEVLGRG